MAYLSQVIQQFPIRKNKQQKAAFRDWAVAEAARLGYEAQVEKKGISSNVVIGDPDRAQVIFTAHYDTPAVMPLPNFITPCNRGIYLAYQMALVVIMFLLMGVVTYVMNKLTGNIALAVNMGYVALIVLLALMMVGPANKNNWNDNTSGTLAVLELMAKLPESQRGKVAFILFDNEEKGMLGSAAFASKHKQVKKNNLVINMDCVGDGENILFFANKRTRKLPEYDKLNGIMENIPGCTYVPCRMEKCMYPSDQASFKYGIAVCACRKGPKVGYYCTNIHTAKDLICDQRNLDYLVEGLSAFVKEV